MQWARTTNTHRTHQMVQPSSSGKCTELVVHVTSIKSSLHSFACGLTQNISRYSGPGGDRDTFGNHWTARAGGGCFDAQYGTSFSAPAVAGGIALMLEANPSLTWRDVQGIIASTSTVVSEEDPSWVTNGAFLRHSNLYGFGIFDAVSAVIFSLTR